MTPPARSSSWKWWVCGVLLLATLLNYMDRQALAQTATELKQLYHLHDARYGQVEKWFSYAFAVGSVVFGLLADRFGPWRLYPLVLVGWSLAGIVTPFAADPSISGRLESPGDEPGEGAFRWLVLCRTVLGFFEAGHWPCALITARQVLTAADRPFGNGLLQSGATVGAVLVPLYVMLLRALGLGWEVVFWTVGAVGLLWVPVWFALVRRGDLDGPPPPPASGDAGPADVWGFVRRVAVLVTVVTCIGVSWQFVRAWLPKYLKEYHQYPAGLADLAVAGYYIAADVGCILAGFAVKWLAGRGWGVHPARVLVYAGWAGLTALAVAVPALGGSPWVLLPALMLVGAGVLGLHPVYYALAQELPAKHMGVLSGALAAVTWVVVGTVQGRIGAHIEATKSYDAGFVIAGLAPLAGLAALLVLWRDDRRA
ncbi:MFS transporter [Urbifossiella limnaea]|uniref:Putative sulfoacetate transporter SauU n=1 Tax=Urbifossiella limnaea TaxID=2528023 RepID=A0A517Y2L7_9BACT|nr:MFS transporter [Urbifossiella limnaea]QDU24011.1 putative sulfoacetate transporter SauU [Urbifossiella limnaea]